MNEIFDLCRSIKGNILHITLNPQDCWNTFDHKFDSIINSDQWCEIKFLNDTADGINDDISKVPSDKGGIYLFVLHPDIVPKVHRYILYVGRVKSTPTQNLRKRFREYVKDQRSDILFMRENWGKDLYIRYLPLTDNDIISALEEELIRVIIPPCNSVYPGKLNKAMRAAF